MAPRESRWSVYLIQTQTGQLGPLVDAKSLSWTISLNDTETLEATLSKQNLPVLNQNRLYLEPWWGGIALFRDNIPIFAGPIVARPTETSKDIRVSCKGIRALLARRSPVPDMSDWTHLNDNDYRAVWSTDTPLGAPDPKLGVNVPDIRNSRYYNQSYGHMAKLVVSDSLTKAGGQLPIRFTYASTESDTSDDLDTQMVWKQTDPNRPHYMRLRGIDKGTTVDSVLSSLSSDKEFSPDIMFRPKLDASTHSIYWDMYTGVGKKDKTDIPSHNNNIIWDNTSAQSNVVDVEINYSGSNQANRAFGHGEGDASYIAKTEDTSKFSQGWPLLETHGQPFQSNDKGKILDKARSMLTQDSEPRHQINIDVRAGDGSAPVGSYWPGEYASVYLKGYFGVKEEVIKSKIMRISGDLTEIVTISFKEQNDDE